MYLSVGVNDCFNGRSGSEAILGITDAIKIIKFFSPDTHVVVQKVLPTTKPYTSYFGEAWEDQEYYNCVEHINTYVGIWIDKHKSSCISHVDFEDFILDSNGRFRENVYDDGLHFYANGKMAEYCEEVAGAVGSHSGNDVSIRGSSLEWIDTEPFAYNLKNESFFRWTYNEWTPCDGACGTQRRTAQCVLQHPETNSTPEPVNEAECAYAFINPLERICDISDGCINGLIHDRGVLSLQPGSNFQQISSKHGIAATLTYSLVAAAVATVALCAVFVVVHQVSHKWRIECRRGGAATNHGQKCTEAQDTVYSLKASPTVDINSA